ncbi:RIP metalloprotease RseP [Methylophaga sp.]|uniref:RIP metalloprotease RseP n=1 Tax=Methylophaga sp. TaxID=2024840 RepID=UPI003F69B7F2
MQSLFFFLIALALLIVIHEYGHFWVARKCGVKVLRFSVGFGKPLWRKLGRDGTEYVLAPIPLGGYVKMLDEREGEVKEDELDQTFNRQSLAKRTAIVAAGPVANLLFAVFAYWLMFVIGIPGVKPIIGEITPASYASESGLIAGDEILEVDEHSTPTWNKAFKMLLVKAEQGGKAELRVDSGGTEISHTLEIPRIQLEQSGQLLSSLGITPIRPDIAPVIGKIVAGEPADKAGLKSGDKLISAEGVEIRTWAGWVEKIQANAGQEFAIKIERDGKQKSLSLEPTASADGTGRIGAGVDTHYSDLPQSMRSELHYGPLVAVKEAVSQTWLFAATTLKSLFGMLTGEVSTKNLGGPITIAQIAGSSAEQGLITFISFLAMISITLGVLNLLPIPMLDGGHLAMFLVEAVRGRPISEQAQIKGQRIGLFLLLLLMFTAFFNDLTRLFG